MPTKGEKGPSAEGFGARLKKERELQGLTQFELSVLSGVQVTTLSRYERGHVLPTLDLYAKLCRALKLQGGPLLDP